MPSLQLVCGDRLTQGLRPRVERAAREFAGWLASGYRRTPEAIIAAHQRFRSPGASVRSCAPSGRAATRTPAPPAKLDRYADAGFDDAVVLIEPAGPRPEQVRAPYP